MNKHPYSDSFLISAGQSTADIHEPVPALQEFRIDSGERPNRYDHLLRAALLAGNRVNRLHR